MVRSPHRIPIGDSSGHSYPLAKSPSQLSAYCSAYYSTSGMSVINRGRSVHTLYGFKCSKDHGIYIYIQGDRILSYRATDISATKLTISPPGLFVPRTCTYDTYRTKTFSALAVNTSAAYTVSKSTITRFSI